MTARPEPAFRPSYDDRIDARLDPDRSEDEVARGLVGLLPQLRLYGLRTQGHLSLLTFVKDDAVRAGCANALDIALRWWDRVVLALCDDAERGRLHPLAARVLSDAVAAQPEAARVLEEFVAMARRCEATVAAGDDPHDALEALAHLGHGRCSQETVALGAAIEAGVARWRADAMARAATARRTALAARDRIEDIARTVRLISLNARVEAARAGDAGRAFGVIAEEIKALSEQTAEASADLGGGIDAIVANLRFD